MTDVIIAAIIVGGWLIGLWLILKSIGGDL
jgi:hypothetical protein